MDDRQETSLIELMVCCVKQAATGEYPVGRGPVRKVCTQEHWMGSNFQYVCQWQYYGESVSNLWAVAVMHLQKD